jgi:hypothetical protein
LSRLDELGVSLVTRPQKCDFWLRPLARELLPSGTDPAWGRRHVHDLSFALAMLADAPTGKARRADLGLSLDDLRSVKAKVATGYQVLGLRCDRDPAVGTRFDTPRRELGDNSSP